MRNLEDAFGDLIKARAEIYKTEENIINEQAQIVEREFSKFIGKCYKQKNTGDNLVLYKVIGLPEVTQSVTGSVKYEPYLLHAIVLRQRPDDVPTKYLLPKLSFMNVYCCRRGADHILDEYEEISQYEFDDAVIRQIHGINSYKEDKVV